MKKSVRNAVFILCALALWGCGVPDKHMVSQPIGRHYATEKPSMYSSMDRSKPKKTVLPPYLHIEEQQKSVVEEDVEVTLPSMIYIGDRIHEYSRKLDLWKELDSQSVTMDLKREETERMVACFRKLQSVMNGYGDLRAKILQMHTIETTEKISSKEIFELQKTDISFLESSCGRLLTDSKDQSVGWSQREEGADLSQLETLIDRNAENKEYEEIIQVWLQIPEFQRSRVHLRTKILYGSALMYLHQEEKAAEIYQQVVDQMSDSDHQATDLVSLRKILADLYTASGQYKSATLHYKQISEDYLMLGRLEEWSKMQLSILERSLDGGPELIEYSSILRNFLGFIPERDGYKVVWQTEKFLTHYPYSPVSSNVDSIKESTMHDANGWFDDLMNQVGKLQEEKKFQEALEFLETIPTDILSADNQILVKNKNEEVLLAEAVERETEKMVLIQELQHQWNKGMVLAKDNKYDEAIDVFISLLDTEYSVKAETKLNEISLEAAKKDRKKAANLFVRFTKTTDLESRKKLLVESRKLLKNILVKYPEVEIGRKVRRNIERVESEMNAIDPLLVVMADQVEEVTPEVDGIDSAFAIPGSTIEIEQQPIVESDLAP